MFSNSIKRLSESLAQAQEQARQQRLRSQQRSPDSTSMFDADKEETSIINGDDPDSNQSAEDTNKPSEETKNVSRLETKDTSLPKEVRIKLAKLAKYEDRHPSKPPLLQIWLLISRIASCLQGESSKDKYIRESFTGTNSVGEY
jgi:hypothetical protein